MIIARGGEELTKFPSQCEVYFIYEKQSSFYFLINLTWKREKNLIKKRNEFMIRTKSRREQRSGEGVNSSYCETPKGVKLRRKNAKRKSQREQGCKDHSWKTFNVFYWKYLLIWDIFWCIAMHFL